MTKNELRTIIERKTSIKALRKSKKAKSNA